MDQARRRMAIGVFATIGDVERVISRLRALGITQLERLSAHAEQSSARPVQNVSAMQVPAPDTVTLRVYLQTPDEEQIVATTLLESAARSVQLHDIDPPM